MSPLDIASTKLKIFHFFLGRAVSPEPPHARRPSNKFPCTRPQKITPKKVPQKVVAKPSPFFILLLLSERKAQS